MQGIIFVTWEQFLAEHFGSSFLKSYRAAIGETAATAPLTSRIYDDATLLAGVRTARQLTGWSADTLLRAYGRYFLANGLTTHLCSYLLTRVQSGHDLLLIMSDAHAQMHRASSSLLPPLFGYEALSTGANSFILTYDSHRQLCPLLVGAIEGAAERYGEQVEVVERTCMRQGAHQCRFVVHFSILPTAQQRQHETPQQQARLREQKKVEYLVWSVLPSSNGITLTQLQGLLQGKSFSSKPPRPMVLLEALHHLQHAGLISSSASQQADDLTHRHYWRAPTHEKG